MKIEKILLLSKGSVLDSVSGHRLRMYKEIDEHITSSSAVEGHGRGGGPRAWWRASGAEEGAVEGHGRARRRGTGVRGGGRTRKKRAAPVSRKANGRGARKKRAAVFDEEEDERIDLRQALEVIYQRELLPVPATNRE